MTAFRDFADLMSVLILPVILVGIPLFGLMRRVPVYERFVEGAKDGFTTAVRIIPYIVAILVAIGMFRASGAMEAMQLLFRAPLGWLGIPAEVMPMAIVRPLSGSGSLAVLGDMVRQFGADSIFTKIAATIYGSSETTFYTLAVYFGAINIRKTRHAVAAGIVADVAGVILATWVVTWMLG